jgi:uncharacterized protein
MDQRAIRAAHYQQLCAKVDAFFARVQAKVGDQMQCASGCSSCCQSGLSVTEVEAEALADWWHTQSTDMHSAIVANIRQRLGNDNEQSCAALDPQGRCMVYQARPLVCRSHGLPVRMRDERSLPVVTACDLNFVATGPDAVASDLVLDQETLSRTLLAIHAGQSARVDLAELLLDFAQQQ